MSTPPKLPKALKFSLFRKDPSRRVHFVHSTTMGSAIQRFEDFQHLVLNRGVLELHNASLVLACLLAFDGLAIESDLDVVSHDVVPIKSETRSWRAVGGG